MTSTLEHRTADTTSGEEQTPAKHHPDRWNLHRAGIVNVWHYYDTEFDLSGGRLVLRGTNGSGKSRALEMLLPFVFDADRRRMDATGSAKVQLTDLMRAGSQDASNRVGYLWVELRRRLDPTDPVDGELATDEDSDGYAYLTLGAHLRYSRSTGEVKPHYFTTPLRAGHTLPLLSPTRDLLSREHLTDLVGADRITTSPAVHRDRVRSAVFGLAGESAAERYDGLLQLLHTLRSPDVGNRIEEGRLPQILADALPPLSETALSAAGERLDSLSETRAAQERLEAALEHVRTFLGTYRRYAAATVAGSADAARTAAEVTVRAVKTAQRLHAEHTALEERRSAADADLREIDEQADELDATIAGIKESKAYADARDLDERENRVRALGTAADIALSRATDARLGEGRTVAAADQRAGEVGDAGQAAADAVARARQQLVTAAVPAGLVERLPESLTVTVADPAAASVLVRETRGDDPHPVSRRGPRAVTVAPVDLDGLREQVAAVRTAVDERAQRTENRVREARRVEDAFGKVEAAETAAAQKSQAAEAAQDEATVRAEELTGTVETYVTGWRQWLTDPTLGDDGEPVDPDGTGHDDPGTAPVPDQVAAAAASARGTVEAALADTSDLLAAVPETLTGLDAAAARITAPRRDRLVAQVAALDADDRAGRELARALRTEQRNLEAAVDPAPATAAWHTTHPDGSVPLWRAVEFAPGLDATTQAGIEGALLASGLLTASIARDGRLRAANGELLASAATGTPAARSVAEVLRPDANSDLPPETVHGILARVALEDPGATVADGRLWVATDGSWGAGPLTGRHHPVAARHVGAAARAAARAARLDEIADELTGIDRAAAARDARRAELAAARETLEALVDRAPRSQEVATGYARATDADARAEAAEVAAATAHRFAEDLRRQWVTDRDRHRQICAELGLPDHSDELATVHQHTRDAGAGCGRVLSRLEDLSAHLGAHAQYLDRVAQAAEAYETAQRMADTEWGTWHREAATFEAVAASVGQEAEEARAELAAAQSRRDRLRGERDKVADRREGLISSASAAEVEARTAQEAIAGTVEALHTAAAALVRRCALPGLADAAFTDDPGDLTLTEESPAAVTDLAARVLAAVRGHATRSDEGTVARAQQGLERDLSGDFDVHLEIVDGVRLVSLSDAAGVRSVAAAAEELTRAAEQGRSALTDKERQVFTEFVLGGVAEELRRRLAQAEELIEAMNASLGSIRTSHGIGVKLRWRLDEAADPEIARIRDLVSTAGEVRSMEQTAELTALLKGRVDAAFAVDASAGYAAHLTAALDYRNWYRMDVLILGPGKGQERRISRKAKLSQGEIRFVSYVTLFAAVDAYLSGLPDTGRALRMLLLDDAFAKVDDRTIGELMGLLVRLDIDFVMTGHALWGTYPQVPQLDAYEVRRSEGTAAVTTHVHWDGRNRHLRAAGR